MDTRSYLESADVKNRIISSAKSLAQKLNIEIAKGNDTSAFMLALLLAAFKDFIDIFLTITMIGLIPGANFAVGLFLTSFLFFFMLGKGWFLRWRLKIWFWVLGLIFDGLPVFAALPTNSLLVLYAWRLAKKRKAKAEVKLKDLDNLTEYEIAKLDSDISLLELDDKVYNTQTQQSDVRNTSYGKDKPEPAYREPLKQFDSLSSKQGLTNQYEDKLDKAA